MLKGLAGAIEPRFVFFPYKGEDQTPAAFGIRYEAVRLTTADGERLAAWDLAPERPIADVAYFHGNGGNLSLWLPVLAALHRQGLRVLAVDYRGYGLSTGAPSEAGVYLDAEAAVRHLQQHRTGTGVPMVFWGRSLGGPIAAAVTRAVSPDGLILESTFPDKASVAATHPVLRVLNWLSAYRFSTVEPLRGFRKPVLVVHGERDSIVPIALGRSLYAQLEAPRRFVALPGAGHNDFFAPSDSAYWTPVLEFVAQLRAG